MQRSIQRLPVSLPLLIVAAGAACLLAACGGGSANTASAPAGAATAAAATSMLEFDGGAAAAHAAGVTVEPSYHLAPVLADTPSAIDADGSSRSAFEAPNVKLIPEAARLISTRRLAVSRLVAGESATLTPSAASAATVVYYRPAQIRAAYGLPALPASYANLSATQLAQYGAGQTIYIIDSYDDQMIAGELGAFSQLFGIPDCNAGTLAPNASLPLAAPTKNGCDFYKVYSAANGTMTATAPTFDPKWAVEIALDVQWAHAMAPLARIVLIEAPDATFGGLTGAIQLANKMGPGVVSMSFGGSEGSYVLGADSYFQVPNMTYFAATGDNGEAVSWPSVSPYVVAVGGTTLNYSGSGARSEVAWSGTGGGVSAFEPTPAYQTTKAAAMPSYGFRAAADVAFNADPNSGQMTAVIPNQTTCSFCQVSWVIAGGTSLATPQWAGLAAVVNAMRVQAGKSMLGDPHVALYTQISSTASTYAANLYDVSTGNDGTCTLCLTRKGYDVPTGLGTPNASALINTLTGLQLASAPTVSGGYSISAIAGKATTFTATVNDANAYVMSLQGAPAGMTISSKAVVTWSLPVAGTYTVNVVATDSKTGLTGQGVYTVFVATATVPVISSGTVAGTASQALTFPVIVSDANPTTLTISGNPSGMTLSSAGMVSWAKPVAGTYSVTITAKDMMNGLTAAGVYSVVINKTAGPIVIGGNVAAVTGKPVSFSVTTSDTNPYTWSLAGAPTGMSISSTGTISWASPVAGNYSVNVVAKDNKTSLIGTGVVGLTVTQAGGPVVTATGLTGKAGTLLSGTIQINDSNANISGVGIGGAPAGMSVNASGGMSTFSVTWNAPVAGTYNLQVSATDAAGKSTAASLIVSITN